MYSGFIIKTLNNFQKIPLTNYSGELSPLSKKYALEKIDELLHTVKGNFKEEIEDISK